MVPQENLCCSQRHTCIRFLTWWCREQLLVVSAWGWSMWERHFRFPGYKSSSNRGVSRLQWELWQAGSSWEDAEAEKCYLGVAVIGCIGKHLVCWAHMSSKTLGARPNWHTSVNLHEKPPDIDPIFSLMLTLFLEEQDFYKGRRLFFLSICLSNSYIENLNGMGIPQVLMCFHGL